MDWYIEVKSRSTAAVTVGSLRTGSAQAHRSPAGRQASSATRRVDLDETPVTHQTRCSKTITKSPRKHHRGDTIQMASEQPHQTTPDHAKPHHCRGHRLQCGVGGFNPRKGEVCLHIARHGAVRNQRAIE
ncbi:hypothetical protein ABVT39_011709 [Epinephelus coioides]